jgi:hypothetical protein
MVDADGIPAGQRRHHTPSRSSASFGEAGRLLAESPGHLPDAKGQRCPCELVHSTPAGIRPEREQARIDDG